jgi:septum formation inhibitor-activating ATPase MinD
MFVHWWVGLICDEWKEKVMQTHKINWFFEIGLKIEKLDVTMLATRETVYFCLNIVETNTTNQNLVQTNKRLHHNLPTCRQLVPTSWSVV